MPRRRLLDLFCGAGGAAVGYHRAGFDEIVGVDIRPQPNYPYAFICAGALAFLQEVKQGDFDFIHASPPCQRYSRLPKCGREYPDLVGVVRQALRQIGTPYVIENVEGAPLENPIRLCGAMFGLKTYRHRLFEASVFLLEPEHPRHVEKCPPAGKRRIPEGGFISVCGHISQIRYARQVMGIDWMTRDELAQAIPPVFTEYVGRQLLA